MCPSLTCQAQRRIGYATQAMPRTKPLPSLSEAEGEAWSGFLRAHALVTRELDVDLRARADITLSEFEILLQLAWAGGERRMAQIAHDAILTGGGVTRIVVRLEKLGLIVRRSCPKDGRGVFAALTERGWTKHHAAHKVHLEGMRRLFLSDASPGDLKVLSRFFTRVVARARDTSSTPGLPCDPSSANAVSAARRG